MKQPGEGFAPSTSRRVRIYKVLSIAIVALWGVSLLIAYQELLPAWVWLVLEVV